MISWPRIGWLSATVYFIYIFSGKGDLWGWAQALRLLGQEWWMQEESRMVTIIHFWQFRFFSMWGNRNDYNKTKKNGNTIRFYHSNYLVKRYNRAELSWLLFARMLVSCPVSCNQCKNKCDDNNVYCKVGMRNKYSERGKFYALLCFFLNIFFRIGLN